MKTPSIVLLGLSALALLVPAQAGSDCWTTSPATMTIPDQTGNGHDLYIDSDGCSITGDPCAFSFWVYVETNHIAGQQRGDEVVNDVRLCANGTLADTDLV